MSAAISGRGAINQLAGKTVLPGSSGSFVGTTGVDGGMLNVNGILGGTIVVNSNGTLTGTGTVGATTVTASRTIATLGTSTLNIGVDLTLADDSITQVTTSAAGALGLLRVNGNASLGGNLSVLAGGDDYPLELSSIILAASGTVSGTYSRVNSNLAFLTPTVTYAANAVELTLRRNNTSYASVTNTRNQANVANHLTDSSKGAITPSFKSVLSKITTLSFSQAQTLFDSMSGRAHFGLSTLGLMGHSLQMLGQHNISGAGLWRIGWRQVCDE